MSALLNSLLDVPPPPPPKVTIEEVPDEELPHFINSSLHDPLYSPRSHGLSPDFMAQIREAAESPTPLSAFLQNPESVRLLRKASSIRSRSRSKSKNGSVRSPAPSSAPLSPGMSTPGMTPSMTPGPTPSMTAGMSPRPAPRAGPSGHSSSSSSDREHRPRDRASVKSKPNSSKAASDELMSLVLAESERQARHLRALLRQSNARLDAEARRADSSTSRAVQAEEQLREMRARAERAEAAQHASALEAAKAKEEIKRVQLVADTTERERQRLSGDVQRLEREKREADQKAAEARDAARKWQGALRDQQAWEDGRAEGRALALRRRFEDGRADGFEEGREMGFEEGFADGRREGEDIGREDGFREGRAKGFEEGRRAERSQRFQAVKGHHSGPSTSTFNEFLYDDLDMDHVVRSAPVTVPNSQTTRDDDRIRQWAASTETSIQSTSPPKSRPNWLRRKIHTDPR
ncbi:hypothetical protein PENSPDRAFT_736922 [Peniophora sp. CONT]|nr:hypothetical protein PENSPDRAFT_736922 [Peniophora sp. CONT]